VALAQHVQWSQDVPQGKTTAHKTVLENGLRARATAAGSGRRPQHQVALAQHVQWSHDVPQGKTIANRVP